MAEYEPVQQTASKRLICSSDALANGVEGGKGVRFTVEQNGETLPAFVIRHQGRVYAYLNRCAHVGVEMDWMQGEFFDDSGLYLICSTHGATYAPASGYCTGGPCKGKSLQQLEIEERDGNVYLKD